jgi:hypothetical protein
MAKGLGTWCVTGVYRQILGKVESSFGMQQRMDLRCCEEDDGCSELVLC